MNQTIKLTSFNPLLILSDKKKAAEWNEITKKHPWGFYIETKTGKYNCLPYSTMYDSINIKNWNIVFVYAIEETSKE